MRHASFVLLSVSMLAVPAAGLAQGGAGARATNPVPASAASIAAGKAAYTKNCRFCHGADAKGNGPMAPQGTHPSDLTDAKWERGGTDGEIFAVIHDGAGPKFDMKGYKGKLSETDIWNVVNFLRSIGTK
jgi:mono/diheme cytochrome c family protein